MLIDFTYSLSQLAAAISWPHLYHAWHTPQSQTALREEALQLLRECDDHYQARARVLILKAWSENDDIVVLTEADTREAGAREAEAREAAQREVRLPMLRQQHSETDQPCLSLADYLPPKDAHSQHNRLALFAATVSEQMPLHYADDPYKSLLVQTLCDRLAEAAIEITHHTLARTHHLRGIRPAVGYPSMPDLGLNRLLSSLLNMPSIGITLTENAMMKPHASVSGLIFTHPESKYFSLGTLGKDQLQDYAQRRHYTPEELKKYIPQ